MLRSKLIRCGTSSEWQSCSDESASISGEPSAEASTRTLNFSPVESPAHVCPLLATESIDSSSKSQSASFTLLPSLSQSNIKPPTSCEFDSQSDKSCAFATRDASRPVFLLPAPTYNIASVRYPANFAGMDTVDVPELVERLGSEEDAVRKMAVFKLQSNIGDPSFAEMFIQDGGLQKLKHLTMNATGNTLAYSLTSFSRLLEVDKGWDYVEQDLIERVVELVVTHPLVNILRGAMSVLVLIVSHPYNPNRSAESALFGFKALKPAIAIYPQFLEMLVSRLSSADHALCANALQLINGLMRDAITNDEESEWPKFIKRLQDLGVIKAVYVLMQSSALQDLAHPLLEFQALTKVLLRKWKEVSVDLQKHEHRRALKGIHLASNPERPAGVSSKSSEDAKPKHNPEKWRRLGFETESPSVEFQDMGFLGMMDLTDYVRKHQDEYQRLLLEQASQSLDKRCPIARASLATTAILYEHFDVDKSDLEDAKSYLALESRTNFDKVFRPLLLHWSRLHVAGLHAFFRLWKSTGAEQEDFVKIFELVRILMESIVGGASRTKDVQDVEEELAAFEYQRLRELQMELLELTYEDVWGQHLRQVREELQHEALQFVREQRIRCLLQGAWFPSGLVYKGPEPGGPVQKEDLKRSVPSSFRYVQLSHNRRFLHYADFESMLDHEPELDALPDKIDLGIVSSVVSNVSASSTDSTNSGDSVKSANHDKAATTKITIHRYLPQGGGGPASRTTNHTRQTSKESNPQQRGQKEAVLLTLHPQSHSMASEWLDGLLMLLNQQPITAETNKLINMVSSYGLKIRLLNVRFDERDMMGEAPEMPSREGLDEDYYYDVFGGQ
ncbi:hypothetical protein GJ744_009350 [Endocarpon pusillum]|uniref:ELMO domain-containing protein n=1 Tax=Endocarpon pusillum TaxID=364733 RepID=A0A8H7E2R1_9EURO|nr:hypothetical protein GJ744_009350 [Endocarpon pusillum]